MFYMNEESVTQKEIQIPSNDLVTLLSLIQLASSRGAFRPEEFVDIGNAYNRLYSFLVDLNVIKGPTAKTNQ